MSRKTSAEERRPGRRGRWVQAGQIWNQRTYQGTCAREDGIIRARAGELAIARHARGQAQIEGRGVCDLPG
jgi:hypothetical protein